MIRFHTFEQIHNKKNVGSTKIRVHNLIKNWPEAELYKYGENPDVLIFQKVYMSQDYRMPKYFKGIKILDICDPDWLDGAMIKETVDQMDAVVCPTKDIAEFVRQLTDKPVKVIKDRFDLDKFPTPKEHIGKATKVVWFGYAHNAELLKFTIPSLESRGLQLIIVSNQDPQAWNWVMEDREKYREKYTYYAWRDDAYKHIQEADICVLPKGNRPQDRFKSDNKTVIAKLLGIPVATTAEELDVLIDPLARQEYVKKWYDKTRTERDCKKSVQEYKDLIRELKAKRGK